MMNLLLFIGLFSVTSAYNYYMLAMQDWYSTGCLKGQAELIVYQIHGLWPQYNATSWPENCGGPAYEEITNQTLLAEMNAEWANCNQPPSSLWSHEWNKHMTCIIKQYPGKYTQTSLFQLVLDLFRETAVQDYCNNGVSDCYTCYNLDFQRIPCP
jgi:ribonuclease I